MPKINDRMQGLTGGINNTRNEMEMFGQDMQGETGDMNSTLNENDVPPPQNEMQNDMGPMNPNENVNMLGNKRNKRLKMKRKAITGSRKLGGY